MNFLCVKLKEDLLSHAVRFELEAGLSVSGVYMQVYSIWAASSCREYNSVPVGICALFQFLCENQAQSFMDSYRAVPVRLGGNCRPQLVWKAGDWLFCLGRQGLAWKWTWWMLPLNVNKSYPCSFVAFSWCMYDINSQNLFLCYCQQPRR